MIGMEYNLYQKRVEICRCQMVYNKFAYNNRQYSSTGKSPFFVKLERYLNIYRKEEKLTGKVLEVDEFIQKKIAGEVKRALRKTNKVINKKKTDKKWGEAIKYTKRDLVWVDSLNISSNQPTKKLVFKRVDPFSIIKKIRSSAYKLKISKMWKNLHSIINESKLKFY